MLRQTYRRYDPRLKNLVAKSEDISQFLRYGIPKSTLRQWQKNGDQGFFTIQRSWNDAARTIYQRIGQWCQTDRRSNVHFCI